MSGHTGACHCGAVTVQIGQDPAEAAECNCSLCSALGTLWHYEERGTVTVTGELAPYVQGDCFLATWRCAHCGTVSHWTAIDPTYMRVGVNLRVFPRAMWADLPRRLIDGASS